MIKRLMAVTLASTICALLAISASAQDKVEAPAKHEKEAHVYAPYSKLTLTDDQKKQISAIQVAARAKIKAIETEEETSIEALLNADQKKELAAMELKAKEHSKELSKERYAKAKEEKAAEKAKEAETTKAAKSSTDPK